MAASKTASKKEKKKVESKKPVKKSSFDPAKLKGEIEKRLKTGAIDSAQAEIMEQRAPVEHAIKKDKKGDEHKAKDHLITGIRGLDDLFERGIPKGTSTLIAGGAGSGKTILCLQSAIYHASEGRKVYYMSFEESEERLIDHMKGFGWDPDKLIKKNKLKIKRYSPFDVTRSIDAMLAKEKGELMIDIDPVVLPENFKPDVVILDSLTAISSAFTGREDSYRIYIEQLFRFLESIGSTNLLITETTQVPEIFSTTGVEEFLADGVIVIYNFRRGDVRERAIEVLKMRGEKHVKKMVAMQIDANGIVIYPEQQVFGSQ